MSSQIILVTSLFINMLTNSSCATKGDFSVLPVFQKYIPIHSTSDQAFSQWNTVPPLTSTLLQILALLLYPYHFSSNLHLPSLSPLTFSLL